MGLNKNWKACFEKYHTSFKLRSQKSIRLVRSFLLSKFTIRKNKLGMNHYMFLKFEYILINLLQLQSYNLKQITNKIFEIKLLLLLLLNQSNHFAPHISQVCNHHKHLVRRKCILRRQFHLLMKSFFNVWLVLQAEGYGMTITLRYFPALEVDNNVHVLVETSDVVEVAPLFLNKTTYPGVWGEKGVCRPYPYLMGIENCF